VNGNPNIIQFFGFGFTSDSIPCLITSYGGKSLMDLKGKELDIRGIIITLLFVIVHTLAHGDTKMSNIL